MAMCLRFRRQPVAEETHLIARERYFEYLIDQVAIGAQYIERSREEFELQVEVQAFGSAEADEASMQGDIGILPTCTWLRGGPAEVDCIVGITKVQSPSIINAFNAQSFAPPRPSQTTCEDS